MLWGLGRVDLWYKVLFLPYSPWMELSFTFMHFFVPPYSSWSLYFGLLISATVVHFQCTWVGYSLIKSSYIICIKKKFHYLFGRGGPPHIWPPTWPKTKFFALSKNLKLSFFKKTQCVSPKKCYLFISCYFVHWNKHVVYNFHFVVYHIKRPYYVEWFKLLNSPLLYVKTGKIH